MSEDTSESSGREDAPEVTQAERGAPPKISGRVLPTLNPDGTRYWIRPKPYRGRLYWRRFAVAWGLMLLFAALPYLPINGKPAMLLDIPHRQFTFFGTTFFANDTTILLFLLPAIAIAIFFLTALFGRVWCGWTCPQTVYMEFLFRPIERLLEGSPSSQRKIDKRGMSGRRAAKLAIYLAIAIFIAHMFLAYFVGVKTLSQWIQRSPLEHPFPFLVMAGTTALIFFDFAYFREQTCLVACPYGRIQSVLLDRHSLVVGYDPNRGEPRGRKAARTAAAGLTFGDCIDCNACVATCPTGIDIRNGVQMECVNCTQCIDACDQIMTRIGKPTGLIRYTSQAELEQTKESKLRPRVIIYPLLLTVAVVGLVTSLTVRSQTEVIVLRSAEAPFRYITKTGVANHFEIKVHNRGEKPQRYYLRIEGLPQARLIAPLNPLNVAAFKYETATIFVVLPASQFRSGRRAVTLIIDNRAGFIYKKRFVLRGPRG